MQDETSSPVPVPGPARFRRRFGAAAGLLAAGVIAGGVLAGSMSASAADDTGSTGTGVSATAGLAGDPKDRAANSEVNRHGSTAIRADEQALDADTAAKVEAAALEVYPGGTVYGTETDSGEAEYEAHMTKADGTDITVLFDKDINVIGTENGGGGGKGGHGENGDARPEPRASGRSDGIGR